MAFGSSSSVFGAFVLNPLMYGSKTGKATGYGNLEADALQVALFGNSVTPDKNAAVASTAYNTGTWLTANEITDATNWVAGGRALSGGAISATTNGGQFGATNTASGGVCTFANPAYGVLVYDTSITGGTVANQGVCFNAFGGPAQVTNGSFTVAWSSNGLFQITSS